MTKTTQQETDKSRFPRSLFPEFIVIDTDGILKDQMGFILDREKWEYLTKEAELFYKNNDDCYIKRHNNILIEKFFPSTPKQKPVLIQKQNRNKRKGFVYLIKEVNGSHYKIGRTVNLDSRAQTFSVKLPFKISLEHSFHSDDYKTAEESLHTMFSDKRIDGEWFQLSDDDVSFIKSIDSHHGCSFHGCGGVK
jgi:hypothetical protein